MGFKVIIVGGSVAGLSLANMLEKVNIDYLLLEAYPDIAPQVGASICLLPNGLRILDQLGCYHPVREMAGNFYVKAMFRNSEGQILSEMKDATVGQILEEKLGYPSMFLDRQMLLQALFNNIQHKEKILPGKRVTKTEVGDGCAVVHTEDGSTYSGDIVVGADGVHSTIREGMWRLARESSCDPFLPDEGSRLKSKTRSIFGISRIPDNYPPGTQQAVIHDGWSYLVVSGPGDRLYWFLFCAMPTTTYGKDIPRWTQEDEVELATSHFDDKITELVTFGDVYKNRRATALVSLEEHVFSHWYFKRFVTIGDSAHKVHPITAQGGNGAIESAALFVNALVRKLGLNSQAQALSDEDVDDVFKELQARRFNRAKSVVNEGEFVQKIVNKQFPFANLFIKWVIPIIGNGLFVNGWLKGSLGAPRLESLALPVRPHTQPFDDEVKSSPIISSTLWGVGTVGFGLLGVWLYSKPQSLAAMSWHGNGFLRSLFV